METQIPRQFRVGVDIGGTFTDLAFLRPDGKLDKKKVPSTPTDYSRAIVEGISDYCSEKGIPATGIAEIVHATTLATNAILERKGTRTALITTEGFRDVLELRRIRIPLSYDLDWEKPVPLVERALRFPVSERVDALGNVLVQIELDSIEPIISEMTSEEVEAVAVCFLHSYRQPLHERQVGEVLRREMPHVHVSLSCEVLPEILEFERTSTTVVNAYVAPLISRYLETLRAKLEEINIRPPILVMQSNGSLISAESAAERAVTIIESGPAAGVVAAARLAKDSSCSNVITLDMGGTTTKASIIERGEILRASEYEVGSPISISSRLVRGSGYILRIPIIDISEVGAGGGSLATLDAGGAMRVGPRSAGAHPGPACYGQGNDLPTVTDANLVLGYINTHSLAGGALRVNPDLSEAAIKEKIADPSGLSVLDAAYGVHAIANSNMVRAIKSVSVERGRDPANFIMMAFGGAGPIHAAGVARVLGIRRVLIPPSPGVFSAFGLLRGEVEHHSARTVLTHTRDANLVEIQSRFDEMREILTSRILGEGFAASAISTSSFVDLRYQGQSSEITVPFPASQVTTEALRIAEEFFEEEFVRTYGYRGDTKDFELVNIRMVITVSRSVEHGSEWLSESDEVSAKPLKRDVYFGADFGLLPSDVLTRHCLESQPRSGPAVIQEYDTTIVVPPDCSVFLDGRENIIIDLDFS